MQRATVDHHLQELRVVLLKSLISDQLAFIHIAKHWFTTADFNYDSGASHRHRKDRRQGRRHVAGL